MPGAHKIGAAISGPRITGRNFMEMRLFLKNESSPNFLNVCPEFPPEFCSENSPNFSKNFRASFPRKQRPEKIHQNPCPFAMQNSQANTKKIFTKCFWRAGKVTIHQVFTLSSYHSLRPWEQWRDLGTGRPATVEKRGTPENSWGGCWEECWGNLGCWTKCWQGCCEGWFSWKGMRSSTLASTPPSTPNFRSTLPSYFWGFPVSLFCSRRPSSQGEIEKRGVGKPLE